MNKPQFYTSDGWINAAAVMDNPATFIVCVGGRDIGKTFGILKEVLERDLRQGKYDSFCTENERYMLDTDQVI